MSTGNLFTSVANISRHRQSAASVACGAGIGTRGPSVDRIGILVVEDNPDHAVLISGALAGQWDWRVECAASIAEARRMLEADDFRVVLADYKLPDGSGLDFVNGDFGDFVTIFVTSQGNEKVAVETLKAGACDYLVKDEFFFEALPGVVRRALDKHRIDTEVERLRSELRGENRLLKVANEELRELHRAKSDFLSTASHELRTPLSIIREFISLLKDGIVGEMSAEQLDCLRASLENCDRLRDLIDDILDLQKMDSGRISLKRTELDLRSVMERCAKDFDPRFSRCEQTLVCDPPESLPPVLGDRDKIIQVLVNLLGNATKYTPAGSSVELRASVVGDRVRVEVSDDGPGIDPDAQSSIFEKFTQLRRDEGPGSKGTGLGLAIVKEIVKRHDSRIRLDSEPEHGARFYFDLPIFRPEMEMRAGLLDRFRASHDAGTSPCLSLLKFGPDEDEGTLVTVARLVEGQFRDHRDELLTLPRENLLVALTSDGSEAGNVLIDGAMRKLSEELGHQPRSAGYSVLLTRNAGSEQWLDEAIAALAEVTESAAGSLLSQRRR